MFNKVDFVEHLYKDEKCMDVAIETMLNYWWSGVAIPDVVEEQKEKYDYE